MTYHKQDIPRIPLTEFMEALGEKPVKAFEGMKLYYAPQRDDPEPMLVVDTNINRWYDHATDLSGDILDLATLKMDPKLYTDPHDFIIKYMNEYEQGKKLSATARQPLETKVVTPDIHKIRLTDFMKALGQEQPVTADGNLRIYKAPYDPNGEPTMVINTETNLWRDTKSGAYGGIYDLAYELTGSCNMSELNHYIAGQMSGMEKSPKVEPPKQEKEPDKPKRKNAPMNIDEIKKISLVEFLNQLGYQPTGRDSKGLWFYSPCRSERKPSFHVNPQKGVWFDFGSGAGGDIFTLAGELSNSTDFIRQAEFIAEKMQMPIAKPYKSEPFIEQPTFENVKVSRLESPVLLRYVADRGIPKDIAQRYCVQVDYQLHGKDYYAIGFENNAHGFELRSPFFKGSYPPKHITCISNGNARCNVFEGFIDFLSAERLGFNDGMDSVVLNSVANIQKAICPLGNYTVIQCYLDNDVAGRAALARLRREFGDMVMDKSALYPDNKDLNDYLMSLYPKKTTKLKL